MIGRATRLAVLTSGALVLGTALHEGAVAQVSSADVCGLADEPPADSARRLERLGEPGRTALLALAQSPEAGEALCGVAGLAALGDRRVIPYLVAALRNRAFREDAYRLARWAAFLAGGPEVDLGAAMLAVVGTFDDRDLWNAAGNDAIWFLGEVDHSVARDRLLTELDRPPSDAALDAIIHALARQGDPRARSRIAALGVEAARAKSGNATPEQASRLGEVAFYQLALGLETVADGFETLSTIAVRDQSWAAAWAVHTLCARAVRRPAERAAIDTHRLALVGELDRLGVSWQAPRGRFGCGGEPR